MVNKYTKIYLALIVKACERKWSKKTSPCYVENHHIKPKCFGGTSDINNLVCFSAREHFVAHKLLIRMYVIGTKERAQMVSALYMMSHFRQDKRNIKISSKEYENIRKAHSESMRQRRLGCKMSDHTRKKLSQVLKGNGKGIAKSKEHKEKISIANKNKSHPWIVEFNKTKKHRQQVAKANSKRIISEDTKEKMRLAKQNYIPWNKGKTKIYSEDTKEKMSESHKGLIPWNKGLRKK